MGLKLKVMEEDRGNDPGPGNAGITIWEAPVGEVIPGNGNITIGITTILPGIPGIITGIDPGPGSGITGGKRSTTKTVTNIGNRSRVERVSVPSGIWNAVLGAKKNGNANAPGTEKSVTGICMSDIKALENSFFDKVFEGLTF